MRVETSHNSMNKQDTTILRKFLRSNIFLYRFRTLDKIFIQSSQSYDAGTQFVMFWGSFRVNFHHNLNKSFPEVLIWYKDF